MVDSLLSFVIQCWWNTFFKFPSKIFIFWRKKVQLVSWMFNFPHFFRRMASVFFIFFLFVCFLSNLESHICEKNEKKAKMRSDLLAYRAIWTLKNLRRCRGVKKINKTHLTLFVQPLIKGKRNTQLRNHKSCFQANIKILKMENGSRGAWNKIVTINIFLGNFWGEIWSNYIQNYFLFFLQKLWFNFSFLILF